jgi:hypothetical protein
MKKAIDVVAQAIVFKFDGGLESVTLRMSEVSPDNATYAMLHGFAARIGDNAAIQKSAENNFTVTEAMRREAVLELVTHYQSKTKDWSPKVRTKVEPQNPHIAAIAAKRGCTYEEAQAWFTARLMAELGAMDGEADAPRG